MCGIVGLFLKDNSLEPEFGAMLSAMLTTMSDRGPDSAGFAVYAAPGKTKGGAKVTPAPSLKLTVRDQKAGDFAAAAAHLSDSFGIKVSHQSYDTHAIFDLPAARLSDAEAALAAAFPDLEVVSAGKRMTLFKEVGLPQDVAKRFALEKMSGTHGVGHTRMATESAVTTQGAHPFSTGLDQCLVHNGSLSNHNSVRRKLVREGLAFSTDNDSEVAAGYLTWRMRQGQDLGQALTSALNDLDGFYTFVVGTESGFGVLRDPIACKPAMMAETDRYVAFGSEYRALVDLPGIAAAKIWEPEPAKVYFWERAA